MSHVGCSYFNVIVCNKLYYPKHQKYSMSSLMSTRTPTAPAARGPVPLWHDHDEIIQIMFVRTPWGVLAYSRTRVLKYSLNSLTH